MGEIEAECASTPEPADGRPVVVGTEGFAAVLDQDEAVPAAQVHHHGHVTRVTVDMHRHDGPCLGTDRALDLGWIDVQRDRVDIDDHRHQLMLDQRPDGSRPAQGRHDHLVAGLEAVPGRDIAQGRDGEQVRRGSGIVADALRESERVGEFLLECVHLRAHGDPGTQQHVDRGNDLVCSEGRLMQAHHRIRRIKAEVMVRLAIRLDVLVNCDQRRIIGGHPVGSRLRINVRRQQVAHCRSPRIVIWTLSLNQRTEAPKPIRPPSSAAERKTARTRIDAILNSPELHLILYKGIWE